MLPGTDTASAPRASRPLSMPLIGSEAKLAVDGHARTGSRSIPSRHGRRPTPLFKKPASPAGSVDEKAPECYDTDIFTQPPSDDVICGICHQVAKDMVETRCGHVFGYECFRTWLNTRAVCPMCEDQVQPDTWHPMVRDRRKVLDSKIRCPQCSLLMELRGLAAHLADVHRTVRCEVCGVEVEASGLSKHLAESTTEHLQALYNLNSTLQQQTQAQMAQLHDLQSQFKDYKERTSTEIGRLSSQVSSLLQWRAAEFKAFATPLHSQPKGGPLSPLGTLGASDISWNPERCGKAMVLSNNNLTAASRAGHAIALARMSLRKGHHFLLMRLDQVRSQAYLAVGVAQSIEDYNRFIDRSPAWVFCNGGAHVCSYAGERGAHTIYADETHWKVGDIVGLSVDMDAGRMELYHNGRRTGKVVTGFGGVVHPAVCLYQADQVTLMVDR